MRFRLDSGQVVDLGEDAAAVAAAGIENHPLPHVRNRPKVDEQVAALLGVLPVTEFLRRGERILYVKRPDRWFYRGEVVEGE